MEDSAKLSNIQLELLKIFHYNLPEEQLVEIKNILIKYFEDSATKEMGKLWDENSWSDRTMKDWSNEHLRNRVL